MLQEMLQAQFTIQRPFLPCHGQAGRGSTPEPAGRGKAHSKAFPALRPARRAPGPGMCVTGESGGEVCLMRNVAHATIKATGLQEETAGHEALVTLPWLQALDLQPGRAPQSSILSVPGCAVVATSVSNPMFPLHGHLGFREEPEPHSVVNGVRTGRPVCRSCPSTAVAWRRSPCLRSHLTERCKTGLGALQGNRVLGLAKTLVPPHPRGRRWATLGTMHLLS